MRLALTRPVSPSIDRCALTHRERSPIDLDRAREEHHAYEDALRDAGCIVERLPAAPDLPDAVFVEDAAVVTPFLAVVARPGARTRRPEVAAVAARLGDLRPLVRIRPPATLDGGDVLIVGDRAYVGRSTRTNLEGIRQLRAALAPVGIAVARVPIRSVLHLKSAATAVADGCILLDPAHVDAAAFRGLEVVTVDPSEPGAANALRIGDAVIYPDAYPATRARLRARGLDVLPVPASELAKAEGGVTCCSLIVDVRDAEAG